MVDIDSNLPPTPRGVPRKPGMLTIAKVSALLPEPMASFPVLSSRSSLSAFVLVGCP